MRLWQKRIGKRIEIRGAGTDDVRAGYRGRWRAVANRRFIRVVKSPSVLGENRIEQKQPQTKPRGLPRGPESKHDTFTRSVPLTVQTVYGQPAR